MLSLAELRHAAEALDECVGGHRLERVVQQGESRVVLTLYGREESDAGGKRHILLSCASGLGRVSELEASPTAPDTPPSFVRFLRAHIARSRFQAARILGQDRQLALRFDAREGMFDLVLSLMGARSNLYVLDADGILRAALRPLVRTRRSLAIGSPWQNPPRPEKPSPGEDIDRWAEVGRRQILAEIEAAYRDRESEGQAEALGQLLGRSLRKERKAAQRRLERLEAELAEADQAGVLQRHGDLLKGALGQIEPGACEIGLRDYETGEVVRIPLDPAKSPVENLELTFKRYQKLVRRLTKAGGQVDEARARCDELTALEAEVAELIALGEAGREGLEALAARPAVERLVGRRSTKASPGLPEAKEPKLPPRLRGIPRKFVPRRYRSADGLEIWVGRSDEGNDYLTTRLARGNDLFFHVDGSPGSHVILRTEGRTDPPSESLLDACELAVRFSKQKNAGQVDVHVVPIKQVKKPKGAKRGLVWVTGGKSIHLRRDEKRLERVMESKIED